MRKEVVYMVETVFVVLENYKNSKNITFIGWFAPIWTILGLQTRLTGLHQHAKSQGGS